MRRLFRPAEQGGAAQGTIQFIKETIMAYLAPTEFVTKMIDAGESKILALRRFHTVDIRVAEAGAGTLA